MLLNKFHFSDIIFSKARSFLSELKNLLSQRAALHQIKGELYMEAINNIVGMLNGPIWGVGMLVLIVGSGLYFTIRLGFFQFVHFKDMWSRIIDKSESESGISSFASFCTTMAMRVGTGNVAGVAVALYMGGPGALFWMIIAGMTNSAVCFTECTLSVLYILAIVDTVSDEEKETENAK